MSSSGSGFSDDDFSDDFDPSPKKKVIQVFELSIDNGLRGPKNNAHVWHE
jgi:hypothetical protein